MSAKHCSNTFEKRLMNKVLMIPFSDCWIFIGATKSNGYGDIWSNGKVVGAHRAAYEHFVGTVPPGLDVCHKCDVRCCVNPRHLFIGTRKDNMADCRNKGRTSAPNARLTAKQVMEIVESQDRGSQIAKRLGISQNTVSRIRKGNAYVMPRLRTA